MSVRWLAAGPDVLAGQVPSATRFWSAVTGTSAGPPAGPVVPLTAVGEHPYLGVGRVDRPDAAVGWHLDLFVDDPGTVADRATGLGATAVRTTANRVTATSPGGLPFGLVTAAVTPPVRPSPRDWPGGRSLLDQLCLDIPADRFAAEADFWSALTGWEHRRGDLPDFDHLRRPASMPLRLLLQRLGPADPGPTRAHADFACDDVAAERRRHESLGARTVFVAEQWTTLCDPVGLAYCLTRRSPGTV